MSGDHNMYQSDTQVNEEEAWLHHVVKDFDYVVCSGKYGPLFYDMLSDDAKLILSNMYNLAKEGKKVCFQLHSD